MPSRSAATPPLNCDIEIETPEQVRFRYQLAGPAQRAAAYLLDLLLRGFFLLVVVIIIQAAGGSLEGVGQGVILLLLFLLEWGYFVALEASWGGRTVGKRVLGLRVVRSDGTPLDWGAALLRNLLRAADILPLVYGVGVLTMATNERFRRLGDWVADTMVIKETMGELERPVVIPPPAATERSNWRPARPLTIDEASLVATLLRRRPMLTPSRVEELSQSLLERLPGYWAGPPGRAERVLELLLFQAQSPRSNRGRS